MSFCVAVCPYVDAVTVATTLHQAALPTIKESCQTFRMRNLTTTICLMIAVLLGSVEVNWIVDNQCTKWV
jgi:hypothetical protein